MSPEKTAKYLQHVERMERLSHKLLGNDGKGMLTEMRKLREVVRDLPDDDNLTKCLALLEWTAAHHAWHHAADSALDNLLQEANCKRTVDTNTLTLTIGQHELVVMF